eukprot:COSAG06_NODE_1538_length_9150_cov_102.886200_4_plen_94_part_00
MSTLYHIGIVKAVVAMGTANFPELTDKVFIVNAPWAAVKGWNLISPMLPPVRAQTIKNLLKRFVRRFPPDDKITTSSFAKAGSGQTSIGKTQP